MELVELRRERIQRSCPGQRGRAVLTPRDEGESDPRLPGPGIALEGAAER